MCACSRVRALSYQRPCAAAAPYATASSHGQTLGQPTASTEASAGPSPTAVKRPLPIGFADPCGPAKATRAEYAASAEDSAVSPVGEADENEEGARGLDGTRLRSTYQQCVSICGCLRRRGACACVHLTALTFSCYPPPSPKLSALTDMMPGLGYCTWRLLCTRIPTGGHAPSR